MKKKNAAPGATGGGAARSTSQLNNSRIDEAAKVEILYLHVKQDGTEEWSLDEPRGVHSLLVTRDGAWEHTRTRNIQYWSGAFATIRAVQPRGAGWEEFDTSDDKWTGWRRPVKP
jgi:hypothetical protein